MNEVQSQTQAKTTRRAFWAALLFYCLVAFEFLYMATPFAVYFYSAYRPGLNILNSIPGLALLSSFFMPHIVVETASPLINAHNVIGGILFAVGLLAFGVCAGQVYYHKLARKAEVTGGLYRFIRHPQYTAFILCSFGMLIIWPRFLVLIMFVTMCFVYYFLARVEEEECTTKFGQSYVDYSSRTGMFLPFNLPLAGKLPRLPQAGLPRAFAILVIYALTLLVAVGIGTGIRLYTLNSLYATYTPEIAYVSVAEIAPDTLADVKDIALADADVQSRLAAAGPDARFIAYILPTEWSVPEIPMNDNVGHRFHQDYDRDRYKVIFAEAQFPDGQTATGSRILLEAVHKVGVVEVWTDLSTGQIVQVLDMPEVVEYDGVPVPIY